MNDERLRAACVQIDFANFKDPNSEELSGGSEPAALLYGKRMSWWLGRLYPEASEALQIAARGQHIRRWEIPRSNFPEGRAGYHQWRTTLYGFHADKLAEIMEEAGYEGADIERVRALLAKKSIKTDPEAQALEDAAALVFIQFHLEEFAAREDMTEEKLIGIIQKTWRKMSPAGHEAALGIRLPDNLGALVQRALDE